MLVLGDNRPRLYIGMLAAGALGGYAMPVYPDATPDEILHVVQDVRVRVSRWPKTRSRSTRCSICANAARRSSTSSTTTRGVSPAIAPRA